MMHLIALLVVINMNFGIRMPALILSNFANFNKYLTTLTLNFFIYKRGITVPFFHRIVERIDDNICKVLRIVPETQKVLCNCHHYHHQYYSIGNYEPNYTFYL